MSRFVTLLRYGLYNQLRGRWLIAYTLFYFGTAFALLRIGADPRKGVASLINVVILVNPAVAVLHSSVFWYSSSNFNQLLLMQPVRRTWLLLSAWASVALGLSVAFVLGVAGAFVVSGAVGSGHLEVLYLLLTGALLNLAFCGVGILSANISNDRMRGIGLALGAWLYFSLVHDGLVFLYLMGSRDYAVEGPVYAMMVLNPIDLARLLLLIQFDFAALLGYTGSLLQRMASSPMGVLAMVAGLVAWTLVPVAGAVALFRRKDL